ncbi:MAG: efflux RND transporter periplasmic adaptor subunit [Cyclobacteriaceae bacterium]
MKNIKHVLYISMVVLYTLMVFAFFSCQKKEEKKAEVLRPVKYQIVGASDGQRIRTFSGVAKAADAIDLSFRVGGVITEVNAWSGNKVKKGDLIARLDNVEARLSLEKSISALNSAQSDLNTAKSELERVKVLYEKSSVSLSDYQASKNAYQVALSQYESAERNKSIQETQVSYGYIYAPKDGVIAGTDGGIDENVSAGHQFATLNAGDGMQVELGIPENLINEVKLGMEVSLAFSSIDKEVFEGSVIEIAEALNSDASTFPVKVEVINPINRIKPGMASKVTFAFGEDKKMSDTQNRIMIPVKTVGEDGEGNFVFVIETDNDEIGTVKKRKVVIGALTMNGFEIKSGLSEGEKIATAGLQTLLDGQKVKLQ